MFYPGIFLGEGENYLRGEGGEDLFSGGKKHSIRRKNRNSPGGKIDFRGGEKARDPTLGETLFYLFFIRNQIEEQKMTHH